MVSATECLKKREKIKLQYETSCTTKQYIYMWSMTVLRRINSSYKLLNDVFSVTFTLCESSLTGLVHNWSSTQLVYTTNLANYASAWLSHSHAI